MDKSYVNFEIGHAKSGWYVACKYNTNDDDHCMNADYLIPNGQVRNYAGQGGYFSSKANAEAALFVYKKSSHLPDELFDI